MGGTEKDKVIDEIKNRPTRMAICYDFDKTLSPDDMQTLLLTVGFVRNQSEIFVR